MSRTLRPSIHAALQPSPRGYPIEQLASQSSFLECAYLLIYGSLPTRPQLAHFEREVLNHGVMHADASEFFRSFRYDAHPMAILTSAFAYLGSYYSEANPSLQGIVWISVYMRSAEWSADGPLASLSRPEPLHKRCKGEPCCTSEHGQANLQAYRESDDARCNGLSCPTRKRLRGTTDRDELRGVVCTLSCNV